ncbi:MAG: PAS domain S-box protein [Actinomycetota bacterium]
MRTSSEHQHGPPRLVLRFAVYAGAAVLLAVMGALLLSRFNASESAESDLADDAAYVADELGRDDLVRVGFERRASDDVEAQLDEFLGPIAGARDLTRASLVAPDGTITYSTDHTLRGKPAAALGIGTLDASAPVQWVLETGRTRGSFVAERDDAIVAAEVRRAFLTQSALVVLALLLLYGALIPVFRKVTAELEARNRRLVESEGRYRTLMEQASDAIFVADAKGRLTDVNEHATELLGYTRDELLQRHAMDLMSIGDVAQLPLHMRDLKAGKPILVERPVRRKDGTFLTGDISAKILEDGRLMTSIRDVSERTQLREAQKLEAVGRFASGIADDFSELVDAVARHADKLALRLGSDPDVEEIRSRLAAIHSLTAQLRAVGSRQELKPELLDLNEFLHARLDLLRDLAGPRVEVVLRPGAVERVYADEVQLERVIVDLVLHAHSAMPNGGKLTVETDSVDFSRNGRTHGAAGPHAMLSINDTGGETGDERGERLGLGLATVYGVVHQSGGSIGVESEPGEGTTVRIYLPVAEVLALDVNSLRERPRSGRL